MRMSVFLTCPHLQSFSVSGKGVAEQWLEYLVANRNTQKSWSRWTLPPTYTIWRGPF